MAASGKSPKHRQKCVLPVRAVAHKKPGCLISRIGREREAYRLLQVLNRGLVILKPLRERSIPTGASRVGIVVEGQLRLEKVFQAMWNERHRFQVVRPVAKTD